MSKHTFPLEQSLCITFITFDPHSCEPERTEAFCSLHSCAISQLFLTKTKIPSFGISRLNGMHATRLEASLYFLTHVLKIFSARGENKGVYSVSTTVKTGLFVWEMNKPLTVSLEGIGHFVLHPDILFSLQSSPHTLHSSCPPNTTGSWAGKHWGPSLPEPCTHLEATGFCRLTKAPMLSAQMHRSRFAELLLAKCEWQLSCNCCCLAQIPSNAAENMKSR